MASNCPGCGRDDGKHAANCSRPIVRRPMWLCAVCSMPLDTSDERHWVCPNGCTEWATSPHQGPDMFDAED